METATRPHPHQASPSPTHSGLLRSIAKLVRLHRRNGSKGGSGDDDYDDDGSRTTATGRSFFFKPSRLKQSGPLDGSSGYARSEAVREEDVKRQNRGRETSDTVLAMVFAGVSAIKAAYAQLQLAQAPYDPEAVQVADLAVVAELQRISQIKHWYFSSKQQHLVSGDENNLYYHQVQVQMLSPDANVVAEILEMRSLIKTYQVTTKKLENELKRKDEEVARLGEELKESQEQKMEFEQKLRALMVLRSTKKNNASSANIPKGGCGVNTAASTNGTTTATHDEQHPHLPPQLQRRHHYRSLSSTFLPFSATDDQVTPAMNGAGVDLERLSTGLFSDSLRRAVRSARAFTRQLVSEMQSAGWDVCAAAAAIVPDVALAPLGGADNDYLELVLQSYICRRMFSAFQYPQFKTGREKSKTCDIRRRRERFLEEFQEMEQQQLGWGRSNNSYFHGSAGFEEFIRDKYRTVVHPRMEAAFFGGGEAGLGLSFPTAAAANAAPRPFFRCFHEMARRVWMLQRLFHAFEPDAGASLFEAPKGCRFSELYMHSILPPPAAADADPQCVHPESAMGMMVVGFTVVPGFKLRGSVIPCRVFLLPEDGTTPTTGW